MKFSIATCCYFIQENQERRTFRQGLFNQFSNSTERLILTLYIPPVEKRRSRRTRSCDRKDEDGEDVDVLRRPGSNYNVNNLQQIRRNQRPSTLTPKDRLVSPKSFTFVHLGIAFFRPYGTFFVHFSCGTLAPQNGVTVKHAEKMWHESFKVSKA